jgi:hypothetical protein
MSRGHPFAYVVIPSLLAASCGGVHVGPQRVSYSDLCDDERPFCRAFGDASVVLQDDRPLFDGDVKSYLASLVVMGNVRQPRVECFNGITDNDYNTFTHDASITILEEKKIGAQIQAAVKAALAPTQVNNAPAAEASLAASITSTLESKNYLKLEYKQYVLRDAILNRIRDGAAGTPEAACRARLSSSPGLGFVWSMVTITAETNMNSDVKNAIGVAVDASLKNFTINSGPIPASVSASLSASISSSIETSMEGSTKEYKTVYSYGFWNHLNDASASASHDAFAALKSNAKVTAFGDLLAPPQVASQPASLVSVEECRKRCDDLCAGKRHTGAEGHFCSSSGGGRQACLYGDPGVNRPRCNDAAFLAQ